jgi:hypothetical protein
MPETLLRTSILDHLCSPLCDVVLLDHSASGQETLEYVEHANLFIVPWTTSGVGTAVTLSLLICYGSDCSRTAPRHQGMRGGAWPAILPGF